MWPCVFVDACTLGVLCNPGDTACKNWAINLRRRGKQVRIPEIADYEVRRDLLRANSTKGIEKLDEMLSLYDLVPLCTESMQMAARFWADVRTVLGRGGCDDKRLDGDVILCAQAVVFARTEGTTVEIATDNVRHFQALVTAC